MAYRDQSKAKARTLRYRAKKHAEKFGPGAGDMRGRHGHHARGEAHGHWNGGVMHTSHGYVAVAVPEGHHLRQAHGYAYEHDLVAERMLGRRLIPGEVVHHKNNDRADNRPENLVVTTFSEHAKAHAIAARRGGGSRFLAGARRPVGDDWPREVPEVKP